MQLALVRDLGRPLRLDEALPAVIVEAVANQLAEEHAVFTLYAQRDGTRREHAGEIAALLELRGMRQADYRTSIRAAARRAGAGRTDLGVLIDGRYGEDALAEAAGLGLWIGRAIELPGSRPLRFEGGFDPAVILREWPADHCVKCLVLYHPDDPPALREEQERQVLILLEACRSTRHELLLEIIASGAGLPVDGSTAPRAMQRLYALGVHPDWWKLPSPVEQAVWDGMAAVIEHHDPHCRGVLLLGLDASMEELDIELVGPPRPNPSWQAKVEGGHTIDRFEVDWGKERVRCPQGRLSSAWSFQVDQAGAPYVSVWFRAACC